MRTRHTATLAAVALALAGAGGYELSARAGGSSTPQPAAAGVVPTATATRPAVLPSVSQPPTTATDAGVASRLAGALSDPLLGPGLAGVVVDPRTGTTLYADHPGRLLPPASTTKLFTAAAALDALGPTATLTTRTVRAGSTVYLVGGGDVTLSDTRGPAAYPAAASLRRLANETVRRLGNRRRIQLRVDSSLWSGPRLAPGWSPGYFTEGDVAPPSALEVDEARLVAGTDDDAPRAADPAAAAGAAFAALLRARHVHVAGAVRPSAAPGDVAPVAEVHSPPVAALVQRMLTTSDNDLAEALGRSVALHDHAPASFAGAAASVMRRVHALGVPHADMHLVDTSGLSRRDRLNPRALTDLLTVVAAPTATTLRPILAGLPVAGFTGTLADRYRRRPASSAAGVLRAKTGTLRGVNALSGLVVDRDGELLAFAFLAPHAVAPQLTENALDRVAARLAGCGCVR